MKSMESSPFSSPHHMCHHAPCFVFFANPHPPSFLHKHILLYFLSLSQFLHTSTNFTRYLSFLISNMYQITLFTNIKTSTNFTGYLTPRINNLYQITLFTKIKTYRKNHNLLLFSKEPHPHPQPPYFFLTFHHLPCLILL